MTAAGGLLIAIPTYNERENIGALLPTLLALHPDADVVVVDDNSPTERVTSSPASPAATGGSTSSAGTGSAASAARIAPPSPGRSSASTRGSS